MADNDDTRERLIMVEAEQRNQKEAIAGLTNAVKELTVNQAKLYRLMYIGLGAYLGIQAIKGADLGSILTKAVGI